MCNFIHPQKYPDIEITHIPETGHGFKITEIGNFMERTPYHGILIRNDKIFKWEKFYTYKGDGFTFFLRFNDAIEQIKYMVNFSPIFEDKDLIIRKISYEEGLCERPEKDPSITKNVKISLAKIYQVHNKILHIRKRFCEGQYQPYHLIIDDQFVNYKNWSEFFGVDNLKVDNKWIC